MRPSCLPRPLPPLVVLAVALLAPSLGLAAEAVIPGELTGTWLQQDAARALLEGAPLTDAHLDELRITKRKITRRGGRGRAAVLRVSHVDDAARALTLADGTTFRWGEDGALHELRDEGARAWVKLEGALPAARGMSVADVVTAAALSRGVEHDEYGAIVFLPVWELGAVGRAWQNGFTEHTFGLAGGETFAARINDVPHDVTLTKAGITLSSHEDHKPYAWRWLKEPPFLVVADALNLREEPRADVKVIGKLFFQAPVRVWGQAPGPVEKVGELEGRWYLVQAKGKLGWAFGPFLARRLLPQARVARALGVEGDTSKVHAVQSPDERFFAGYFADDEDLGTGCILATTDDEDDEFSQTVDLVPPSSAKDISGAWVTRMDLNGDRRLDAICLVRTKKELLLCPALSSLGGWAAFTSTRCVSWKGRGLPALEADDVDKDGFQDLIAKKSWGKKRTRDVFLFVPELGRFAEAGAPRPRVTLDGVLALAHVKDALKKDRDGNVVSIALVGRAEFEPHKLPDDLFERAGLRGLSVSNQQVRALPAAVAKLSRLETLSFRTTRLRRLPDEVGTLSNLRKLSVSSNELSALPNSVGKLQQLSEVDLSYNRFRELPAPLTSLPKLQRLDLSVNELTDLPPSLANAKALRWLWLSKNPLGRVPPVLCRLGGLEELTLAFTQLTEVPGCLFGTDVVVLDLAHNALRSVPPIPAGHPLREIDLSSNQLTRVPAGLADLPELRAIYLDDNPIEVFPKTLLAHPKLKSLGHKSGCTKRKDETLAAVVARCLPKARVQ